MIPPIPCLYGNKDLHFPHRCQAISHPLSRRMKWQVNMEERLRWKTEPSASAGAFSHTRLACITRLEVSVEGVRRGVVMTCACHPSWHTLVTTHDIRHVTPHDMRFSSAVTSACPDRRLAAGLFRLVRTLENAICLPPKDTDTWQKCTMIISDNKVWKGIKVIRV